MPGQFMTILGRQWQTYTWLLLIVAVISVGYVLLRTPHPQRGKTVDVLLGALVVGVLCGRGLHVLFWREYFAFHPQQITELTAGGIMWQGVLFGGVLGAWMTARLRGIALSPLLEMVAPLLPLVAVAGWWGCASAGCAYGAPVAQLTDYPALLVTESRDIFGILEPRFATQQLGMLWSAGVFALVVLFTWRGWWQGRRFGVALILLGAGMVMIGFLRADYMLVWRGFRADQWLNFGVMLLGAAFLLRPFTSEAPSP